MRIGVDGTVFFSQLTGIGNYCYSLLQEMAAMAPEHDFVILTDRPRCVEFGSQNIRVHHDNSQLIKNIHYWKLFGIAGACKRAGVDVFWAANGVGPLYLNVPVLLTVYDFVYKQAPETMSRKAKWYRGLSQPMWIRRAASVVTISDAVNEEMIKSHGRRADAIVRPAVGSQFYKRERKQIDEVKRKNGLIGDYLLIVGTLEPRKNIFEFVDEFLKFRRSVDASESIPELALIGGKGWKDAALNSLLGEAEKEGAVRRLGYVDAEDLPALYSGARTFFMPSRYEGFGMPILEARSCGCPVVCSDVPAMREAGGKGALYHPPTREGIQKVLKDVFDKGMFPASEGVADVDWTWRSGAGQLLPLLLNIGNKRLESNRAGV